MYAYNQVNGGSDTRGTSFGANFGVLESQGDVEAAYWTHADSDYRSQPTAAERADAALHKLTAHTVLFAQEGQGVAAQTAIETALANNQPVALGIPVYGNFQYNVTAAHPTFGLADATGSVLGAHAVAVLGYDSTGVRIENSWGPGWGDGGFATLGWDFVEAKAFEADAIGTFVSGANNLAPAVTGLSAPTVATAGGTALTITAARVPSIDTASAGAVTFVSLADPSVQVSAPVRASTPTTLTVTVPRMPGDGQYRVVLTGSGGTSVPNGTTDVLTALSPYAVVLPGGQVGRSDTATKVTVIGSGFGTTATAFAANKITAKVGGKAVTVTRVDDTHLQLLAPPMPAGTTAAVVVLRNGVAGPSVDLTYLPPLPVVTGLSPAKVAVAGGASVTAAVRNAATTTSATSVTLVSTADPNVTLTAPITAHTATGVTFTTPAAPNGAQGNFHVQITGEGGTSLANNSDVLGYRTPVSASTTATVASAAGGTVVTLTGSGFGATATAFAPNLLTATVAGKAAPLRWVSDTAVNVTVPAGTPGAAAPIVLLHDGVAGPPVTGVSYVALITGTSTAAGPSAGWTTKLTGVGFTQSTDWALVDGDGQTVAALPVVATATQLTAASGGAVLVTSPTSATVKLPAGSSGMYRLVFTPSTSAYPGADLGFSSKAVVVYSDLG
jgi:hypothetical protein